MSRWLTSISVFGAVLIVVALGRAAFGVVSGGAAPGTAVDFALLSAPGFVLWYVAQWLPNTEFDPSLYPRVLAWSLGGVGVMLAFSLLRVGHPGVTVDGSLGTQAIGVAIGSLGGLAIGIREAEAITRARELADRNEALAQRERELEHQNERLDEFTSIVSHDLRNPLNVAEGRLELAREDVASEHLGAVADAHDRMEALVEDLLSLARQGETVDALEPVGLGDLARDRWAAVDDADATLSVPVDRAVRADEQRLGQVFSNLFRNAVEHSSTSSRTAGQSADAVEHGSTSPASQAQQDAIEHGSTSSRTAGQSADAVEHGSTSPASQAQQDAVEHSSTSSRTAGQSADAVEHGGADVAVTVGVLEDGAGFYVEDDGPGIPESDREQVFDHGYTTSQEGTGFGLAIVERVSDAHGWSVSLAESESGGARFEFRGVAFAEATASAE